MAAGEIETPSARVVAVINGSSFDIVLLLRCLLAEPAWDLVLGCRWPFPCGAFRLLRKNQELSCAIGHDRASLNGPRFSQKNYRSMYAVV